MDEISIANFHPLCNQCALNRVQIQKHVEAEVHSVVDKDLPIIPIRQFDTPGNLFVADRSAVKFHGFVENDESS
jgi:hypothetical protein